jgi:hypothetical protein
MAVLMLYKSAVKGVGSERQPAVPPGQLTRNEARSWPSCERHCAGVNRCRSTGAVKYVSGCLAVVPEGAGPASDSKERHMARGHGQGCDLGVPVGPLVALTSSSCGGVVTQELSWVWLSEAGSAEV